MRKLLALDPAIARYRSLPHNVQRFQFETRLARSCTVLYHPLEYVALDRRREKNLKQMTSQTRSRAPRAARHAHSPLTKRESDSRRTCHSPRKPTTRLRERPRQSPPPRPRHLILRPSCNPVVMDFICLSFGCSKQYSQVRQSSRVSTRDVRSVPPPCAPLSLAHNAPIVQQ